MTIGGLAHSGGRMQRESLAAVVATVAARGERLVAVLPRYARHRRAYFFVSLVVLSVAIGTTPAHAVTFGKADTSRESQAEAVRGLPWDRFEPNTAARIRAVVDRPSMYRRLPTEVIRCDADLFRFLTRYPEVVVNIWQLMGITKVSAERTGPYSFIANDGVGTTSQVHLVYADSNSQVLYCDGYYQGPLFKRKLRGRCLLIMHMGNVSSPDGGALVSARLDVFVQIDDLGIDVLTRSIHPLMGKSVDRNFAETLRFVEKVSRTAEENGRGMSRLADRLDNVEPTIRRQFSQQALAVSQRGQLTLRDAGLAPVVSAAAGTAVSPPAIAPNAVTGPHLAPVAPYSNPSVASPMTDETIGARVSR